MAYDADHGRVMLVGGSASFATGGAYLNDTWEWDGKRWACVDARPRPPSRFWHGLAYDRARRKLVRYRHPLRRTGAARLASCDSQFLQRPRHVSFVFQHQHERAL